MDNPRHQQIAQECDRIKEILIAKNAAYGDSAITPLRIFSQASPIEQINVRLDDKLSRLVRGDGTGDEDAELDLIGYLVLKRVARLSGKPEHILNMAPGEGIATIRDLPTREVAEKQMKADAARISSEVCRRVLDGSLPSLRDLGKSQPSAAFADALKEQRKQHPDHSYHNDVKSGIDDVAAKINEAVNPLGESDDRITGESLDALEAEMKKSAAPVVMIDGKPHFVFDFQNGDSVLGEEVPDEWDGYRYWDYGKVIRWRGALYRQSFAKTLRSTTYPPDQSERWTLLPEAE